MKIIPEMNRCNTSIPAAVKKSFQFANWDFRLAFRHPQNPASTSTASQNDAAASMNNPMPSSADATNWIDIVSITFDLDGFPCMSTLNIRIHFLGKNTEYHNVPKAKVVITAITYRAQSMFKKRN